MDAGHPGIDNEAGLHIMFVTPYPHGHLWSIKN